LKKKGFLKGKIGKFKIAVKKRKDTKTKNSKSTMSQR